MAQHRGVARDDQGNSISGASVTVYEAGTTTLATIYSEGTLTTAETNPFETGDDGVYEFWATAGIYDIQIARAGFTTTTLSEVEVGHLFAQAYCNETSHTITGGNEYLFDSTNTRTWTLLAGSGFSINANERLQYDGTDKIYAEISLNVVYRMTTGIGGAISDWGIGDAGLGNTYYYQEEEHSADGEIHSMSFSFIKQIASGDEIVVRYTDASTVGGTLATNYSISPIRGILLSVKGLG